VGIQEVNAGGRTLPDGHHHDRNEVISKRVLPSGVASTETSMLETVLQYGTAKAAAIGQFAAGKTGTTSNFGDAWFVGWDGKYTVAVWVGYPDKLVPMTTEFGGKPVFGGTYPALIWHDFMLSALKVEQSRASNRASSTKGVKAGSASGQSEAPAGTETPATGAPTSTKHSSAGTAEPREAAPATHSPGGEAGGGSGGGGKEAAPATPPPTPASPPSATATSPNEASPTSKSGAGAGATGGVSPSG
jgi:penicillin-binding protein 1A